MRFSSVVLLVASALLGCACSSSSASTAALDGATSAVPDVVLINACLSYGPAGSVCKGGGLCGLGFTSQGQYLCASSTEVCCAPLESGDSGGGGLPDATLVDATVHDAGHDAPHDAAPDVVHETGTPDVSPIVDAGHEATVDATHDSGHDAGHDAPKSTDDASDDAAHHEAGTDAAPNDAKPG